MSTSTLVEKAKQIQQSRNLASQALQRPSEDFDVTSLGLKESYMRLGLLSLGLIGDLKSTSYVRFANLFRARGLCPRSRMALNQSMDDQQQLHKLAHSVHQLNETLQHILSFS